MLELNVQQFYFDAITAGTKTIEGRLAKQKYLALQSGDKIRFTNPDKSQSVIKEVGALHTYANFSSAFKVHDFKYAVPNAKSAKAAVEVYEEFYSRAMQQKFGIVFIELK